MAGQVQDRAQTTRTARGRFRPGQSGNPSGNTVPKRVTVLFEAMAADLGGDAALGALDRAMLMQACRLLVRSERTTDVDMAVRAANAAARLIASLRNTKREREPAGPTLGGLLKASYARQQRRDEERSP